MTAPAPSTNLSLTDRSTLLMIGTIVAAIVLNVFHKDITAYVPLATTIAAGVIAAAVAFSKHHYAAAIASLNATVTSAASVAPSDLEAAVKVVVAAQAQLTSAAQSFGAIASLMAHSGLPEPVPAVAGQVASDIAEVVPPVPAEAAPA
jgi:hypothetical protein